MMYDKIWVNLDMNGCPNRCRHCWLGWGPNGHMAEEDLREAAEAFRPLAREIDVYDWYREPDFPDNYRERWALCQELASPGVEHEHFELASAWRLARDPGYAPWLRELGIGVVQLTLFGGEELTDRFTGRKGAWQDILKAIDALLENGIAPRIQVFVNKQNMDELPAIVQLIEDLRLEERCREIGREFACFVHQGSCDGKNADFYPDWVTPEDLPKIPPYLAAHTLRHFGADSLEAVFGRTEQALLRELAADGSTEDLGKTLPVLFVDSRFDVYPNFTTPSPHWLLGNLKRDGAGAVLAAYAENKSPAQHARATVPVKELAAYGDPESQRLFGRGDYIELLLHKYLEERA